MDSASGVLEVRAQYDPSYSHYFDMEPSFNPAAVGKQSKLNVTAAYALDMAGFEHNPVPFRWRLICLSSCSITDME